MEEKEELVEQLEATLGLTLTPTMRRLLTALAHPSVIEASRRYIYAMDPNSRCLNFASPWNCALEAEAKYENIEHGWLGGINGVSYSDWWCENCRRRVTNQ